MKKAIWILFFVVAVIWTALAFGAASIARWASDAIATPSVSMAMQSSQTAIPQVSETLKTQIDSGVALAGKGIDQAADAVANATAAASAAVGNIPALPALPALPAMPAMPAWVNEWLGPEWVAYIKEWAAWAKASSGGAASGAVQAATSSAQATLDASLAAAREASQKAGEAASGAVQAAQATPLTQLASQAGTEARPWLAAAIGWLVPIVWGVWFVGLLVGLVATVLLAWLVGRFTSGGSGGTGLRPTPSRI